MEESPSEKMDTLTEEQKAADIPVTSKSDTDSDYGEWTTVEDKKKKRKRGDTTNMTPEKKNPSKKTNNSEHN